MILLMLSAAVLYSQKAARIESESPGDYHLSAAAGDYVQVSFEVVRGGLRAALRAPDGSKLLETTSPDAPYFALAAVATVAGDYEIHVEFTGNGNSHYRVLTTAPHPATTEDRALARAWTAFSEGEEFLLRNPRVVNKPPEPMLQAVGRFQEALAIFRSAADRTGQATALTELAVALWFLNRSAESEACYREALALWNDLGKPDGVAAAKAGLVVAYRKSGKFEESVAVSREILQRPRRLRSHGAVRGPGGSGGHLCPDGRF